MSEIKYTIGLLTKQLNLLLNINLKPEHFRLAKYDKTDDNVVPILWQTLNKFAKNEEYIDIKDLKNHMLSLNYYNSLFDNLPEDMSHGSRELLLAISFMISHNLEDLILKQINDSPFNPDYDLIGLNKIEDINYEKHIPKFKNDSDLDNYFSWLNGRIQENVRQITEYKVQNKIMLKKLDKYIRVATDNMSLNKILAFTSKKYCIEFIEKSNRVLEILESFVLWIRKEDVYWKWMSSILANRKTEYNI